MYLHTLEIQGFKSFANKTVFLFPEPHALERGVTGVVGPNGSGKSNVADAIRWVLGEQSKAALRSKRAEDVIFFGSAKKTQLGFCEVSMTFNNEDRTLPLDFSEIVITRRLYRDGESEFLINKNKVRLSDIALLIAQAQCGPKNISVIGQGMIDAIINAPPGERKEYFDEAAGVKQYQIKKDQALQKLKGTQENLDSAQLLVAELEPKMRFFSRLMKRLSERDEIERDLLETMRQYYNCLWNRSVKSLSMYTAKQKELATRIAEKTVEHENIEREFREQEGRKTVSGQDASFTELTRERNDLGSRKQDLLKRQAVLGARLQSAFEKAGEGHLAMLLERQQKLSSSLSRCEEDFGRATKRVNELENDERVLREEIRSLQEAARASAKCTSPIDREHLTNQSMIARLKEVLDLARTEPEAGRDVLRACIRTIVARIEALASALERALREESGPEPSPHVSEEKEESRVKEELLSEVRVSLGIQRHTIESLGKDQNRIRQELATVQADLAFFSSQKPADQHAELNAEKEELDSRLAETTDRLTILDRELESFYEKEKEATRTLLDLQRRMTHARASIEEIKEVHMAVSLDVARSEAHQEELLEKICTDLRLPPDHKAEIVGSVESLTSLCGFQNDLDTPDLEGLKGAIERGKKKLEQIGSVDTEALAEYEQTKQRYEFLTSQIADLQSARDSLVAAVKELNGTIQQRFDDALVRINEKFNHYFKILFSGGTAQVSVLRREHEEPEERLGDKTTNVFDGADQDDIMGIEIYATPPQKKLKNISFLSGGEKALTAIALLCAIVSCNPAPFVVLDEVDASLDDSNARRFADIISELVSKTQFIIITHNRVTIHTAQVLYGVTMGEDGISKVLSLDITSIPDTIRQS